MKNPTPKTKTTTRATTTPITAPDGPEETAATLVCDASLAALGVVEGSKMVGEPWEDAAGRMVFAVGALDELTVAVV